MNNNLKLLEVLLKKGLIKTTIDYRKYIIKQLLNVKVKDLLNEYFNLKDDKGKKHYINLITKALRDKHYNIGTTDFFIVRRQYADFAVIFCRLPEDRLKKLHLIDNDTDDDIEDDIDNGTDYSVIKKGTELFNLITAQDIQRYGFYCKLYDKKDITSVTKNIKKIRQAITKLGVIKFTDGRENSINKGLKDRFTKSFCNIYNTLATKNISDEDLEKKVARLLDFVTVSRY